MPPATPLSKTFAGAIEVDLTAPPSPTVTPFRGTATPEKITGTWAEGDAVSLTVTLGDNVHKLGNSAALSSDGKGNWSLALPVPLAPGRYDVTVETADRAGNVSRITRAGRDRDCRGIAGGANGQSACRQ